MITFIVGKQNTGKSQYYEGILQEIEKRIYFATLWEDVNTLPKIILHKDRRDDNWIEIESCGELIKDIIKIKKTLNEISEPKYCMIDGLVNWCIHCSKKSKNIIMEAQNISEALIELANQYTDVNWYWLDNDPSDYTATPKLVEVCELIHKNIIANIKEICTVEWGKRE